MGKKNKGVKKLKPFVSVCTPTFNRRPFFEQTIQCYLKQTYPKDRMEWVIIDDGTDKIEDLVKDIPGVKYYRYDAKMTLGKKRNLMHEKANGDIIVYMDDDDYYPPTRVSHAVEKLRLSKKCLIAGSSEIYIWFKHNRKMYQFGPYMENHATAGTFAFKKELLNHTKYNENAALAEEKEFLKNYTFPMIQLDPRQTILVFSHSHNTFDKRELLEHKNDKVKESEKTIYDFIRNDDNAITFYTEKIETLLETYEIGLPKYKPDVIKQTAEIRKQREETAPITVELNDGTQKTISDPTIIKIVRSQEKNIKHYKDLVTLLKGKIQFLEDQLRKHDNHTKLTDSSNN